MISLENSSLVSNLRQDSVELEKRNAALKEMDTRKDEFLGKIQSSISLVTFQAITSHEFRTPLNGVIGIFFTTVSQLLRNDITAK